VRIRALVSVLVLCLVFPACGGSSGVSLSGSHDPLPDASDGPAAGNPDGTHPVPVEAQAEDVTVPDHVIGTGTPQSCTAEAFIAAVAQGGTIVFDGGPDPFTITLDEPARVFNDQDPVLRARNVQRLLTQHGILRRYGAVGRSGSISLIERFWRSMKEEYVRPLFLYRSTAAIDGRLERYRIWFNQERPHQGQRQRTPDDVYFARPERPTRDITGGTLHVRFHAGDRRLPILRLRDAA
jgi:hypothetical protein